MPYLPYPAGLIPSTNTSPSRSARCSHRPEAVGLERLHRVAGRDKRRAALRAASTARRSPPRGPAPMTITRPPGRSTRTSSRIDATRSFGAHRPEQARRCRRRPRDRTRRLSARQPRRRRDLDVDERAGGRGALAPARGRRFIRRDERPRAPDRPTFAATAPRRPPCAQPTCSSRSPSFTPVMLTTSEIGILALSGTCQSSRLSALSYARLSARTSYEWR